MVITAAKEYGINLIELVMIGTAIASSEQPDFVAGNLSDAAQSINLC